MRLKANHSAELERAQNDIYDICADYAKNPSQGRTIVIVGENGSGKSHMAKAVHAWAKAIKMRIPLVVDRSDNGSVSTASTMLVNWAEIVDGFKPPRCDYQIIEDLQNCNLLVVDDIGAEHDPSKIGVEKLYIMLSRREKKWNIFTTNFPSGEWAERFDRKISSRLFRNAQHIDLSGVPDYSTI